MMPPSSEAMTAWLKFFEPIGLALLLLVQGFSVRWAASRAKKVETAALEVKQTLENNTEKADTAVRHTGAKLDIIHMLVNSEYAIALRVGADALERIASMTRDPIDIGKARIARRLSDEHDRKQELLDKRVEDIKAAADYKENL